MTKPIKSDAAALLALGNRMGLQGFAMSEKPSVEACDGQKPSAGAALVAATQIGLKGFTASAPAQPHPLRRNESTMALAERLGLPGFVQKETAAPEVAPALTTATDSPTIRVSPTPCSSALQKSATRSALPTLQISKQRFVCINIAAGGMAAFCALEAAMGQSFAAKVGVGSAWLQRDNPDGSQTRGYPAMARELAKLATMSGSLGSPALNMSIGPLSMSEFTPYTGAGRVPTNARASASFVDVDLPDALQRAIAQ